MFGRLIDLLLALRGNAGDKWKQGLYLGCFVGWFVTTLFWVIFR